ncbi:MAG: ImmA/IrrE family metallo-endopeptidase [Bacteroidia bacterium]|nr:ImmA/IrrE family metallo-endopeptidase [Bacteroidia bacterium]
MKLFLKKQAALFRDKNGLSATEPIHFKSLLLKLNVLTFFRSLSEKLSGMAIKVNDELMFIMVNSSKSKGNQHFTISHELYHLYIQENFSSMTCQTGLFLKKDNPNEYYADVFAANLLLPEDGVLELIPDKQLSKNKISIESILKIEHFYQCSRNALLYRLKELNLLSCSEWDVFNKHIKRCAAEYGYNARLYEGQSEIAIIGDYGIIAKSLFDKGKISESHYLSLMGDIGIDLLQEEYKNGKE